MSWASNLVVLSIELILIGIVVIFGMRQYISLKKTPFYATFTTWCGWFLCFSVVFLVPVDILATDHNNCLDAHKNDTSVCVEPITYLPEQIMTVQWEVLYWGTFIFSWAIFPVLQTFATTGDFRFQERLWRAIKENVILYIFMGIAGLIFVLVLLILKKPSISNLVSLIMSLANAYGLILVVLTMGYGLVDVPRNLLRRSDRYKTLRHYRVDAVEFSNDLAESRKKLEEHLRLIKTTSERAGEYDPYRLYLDIVISKCPQIDYEEVEVGGEVDTELTYDKLVAMHTTLLDVTHQVQRAEVMYDRLLGKSFAIEDIINTMETPSPREPKILWSFKNYSKNPNKVKFEYYWHIYIFPAIYKFLGIVCAILSGLIVWSELTLVFNKETKNFSPFALVILNSKDSLNGLGLQIFCFIPLLYMAVCAYTTLFKIRIFNYYRLVPQQLTNSMSIMFSANYLCRLAAPLSFNFIQISALSDSSFNVVMGDMDAFSLGKNFIYFFPIFVAFVCIISLFNVHKRVASCCCIPSLRVVTDTSEAAVEKGMRILKEERQNRTDGVPPPKSRMAILKEFIVGKKKDVKPDGASNSPNNQPPPATTKPSKPGPTRNIQGLSRDYTSKSGVSYKSTPAPATNDAILTIKDNKGGGNSSDGKKTESKKLLNDYWDKLNFKRKDDDDDIEMGDF